LQLLRKRLFFLPTYAQPAIRFTPNQPSCRCLAAQRSYGTTRLTTQLRFKTERRRGRGESGQKINGLREYFGKGLIRRTRSQRSCNPDAKNILMFPLRRSGRRSNPLSPSIRDAPILAFKILAIMNFS
jgi:hypothetical protein